MRAVTIPIDNLSAVGGTTVEGCFVDVIFRSKVAAEPARGVMEIPSTTVTLLENVEVISVGRVADAGPSSNDVVDIRSRSSSGHAEGLRQQLSELDRRERDDRRFAGPSKRRQGRAGPGGHVAFASLRTGRQSRRSAKGLTKDAVTPNKYTLEGILESSIRPLPAWIALRSFAAARLVKLDELRR